MLMVRRLQLYTERNLPRPTEPQPMELPPRVSYTLLPSIAYSIILTNTTSLLEHTKTPLSNLLTFCNDFAPLSPTDKRIPTKDEVSEQISSSHALEILAEIYAEQKDYARVNLALDLLVERFDRIRKNYWEWRRGELVSQGAGAGSEGSGSAAAGVSVGA